MLPQTSKSPRHFSPLLPTLHTAPVWVISIENKVEIIPLSVPNSPSQARYAAESLANPEEEKGLEARAAGGRQDGTAGLGARLCPSPRLTPTVYLGSGSGRLRATWLSPSTGSFTGVNREQWGC